MDKKDSHSHKGHQPISFEELEGYRFSPGVLFWEKTDGNVVKLRDAGDFLDHDYLNKFKRGNAKLILDRVSRAWLIEEGKELFKQFENTAKTNIKIIQRQKILAWIKRYYWEGEGDTCLLDLSHVFSHSFYAFSKDQEASLRGISVDLFKRSHGLASVSLILALTLGYTDFKFLQDIYHLSFLFDVGFEKDKLTFNVWKALEKEREGEDFKSALNQEELDGLLEHAQLSYSKAKEEFSDLFHNPSLMKLINRRHEKFSGEGFPLRVNWDEISDLEAFVIYCQSLFAYENLDYQSEYCSSFLKKLIDANNIQLSFRFKKMIFEVFNNIEACEESQEVDLGA